MAWEDLRVPWLPDLDETVRASATTLAAVEQRAGDGLNAISKGDNNKGQVGGQAGAGESKPVSGTAKVGNHIIGTPVGRAATATNKSASPTGVVPHEQDREVKPSRGKFVITGSLKSGSEPKEALQGLARVRKLLFEIEPGGCPPKGLPVLEKTLEKVDITDKQYGKIKHSLTPASGI